MATSKAYKASDLAHARLAGAVARPVALGSTVNGRAYYLFNVSPGDAAGGPTPRHQIAECLKVRMWGVGAGEPHGHALRRGDLALLHLGAPERLLLGKAELASAVHEWTPSEAELFPGDSAAGVLLTDVEEWDPPVPMETVLQRIDRSEGARADFDFGVVRITGGEYQTAVVVACGR
jgi:hypothetical protein